MAGMHHKPVSIPWGGQWGISSPEVITTRGVWTLPWKKGPTGAVGAGTDELIAACCLFLLLQASQISGYQEHLTDRAWDKGERGWDIDARWDVGCGLWDVERVCVTPLSPALLLLAV